MYFINEGIDKALNDYLNNKNKPEGIVFNSFLVVVIRMLVAIYGELDIINPYITKNEESFNNNLMKYGANVDLIEKLKKMINEYYYIEKRNLHAIIREDNNYFIEIQKCVIDLFNEKRLNYGITDSESKEFFNLLYTPGTSNALRMSFNYLNAGNIYEIAEYYKNSMKNKKVENKEEKKKLLGFDVYKLFNISIADLSKMNEKDIDNLNSSIYKSLNIKENAMNKDYLLEEKIKEITMQNNPVTTGNGYVDILLIMSIIVTVIMIVVIFATIVF